jgi:septation ring formation regulator EzrA
MTIELTILVSVVSVCFAIYFGMRTQQRGDRAAAQKETADMTTVVVKLENIATGITEIKSELRNVKDDVKENRERLIKVEASAKQAHKRLDTLDRRRQPLEDETEAG